VLLTQGTTCTTHARTPWLTKSGPHAPSEGTGWPPSAIRDIRLVPAVPAGAQRLRLLGGNRTG